MLLQNRQNVRGLALRHQMAGHLPHRPACQRAPSAQELALQLSAPTRRDEGGVPSSPQRDGAEGYPRGDVELDAARDASCRVRCRVRS
jgi:hypothetical protein